MPSLRQAHIAVVGVIFLAGCATASQSPRQRVEPGRTITAEDIARLGATDAWDVLRRSGISLRFLERGAGQPRAIVERRGTGSAPHLDGAVMTDGGENRVAILVNGAVTTDVTILRSIPAAHIESIRVVTRREEIPVAVLGVRNAVALVHVTTTRPGYY